MDKNKLTKIITGALIIFGLAGTLALLIQGKDAMGATDQIPWSSLIATYLFFATASVGLTLISSLWYVFGIKAFKMLTKRALALAIISVLLGFAAIGLELGNPFRLVWILFSPNFMSPIWWMGFLYALYLAFRMVTVYFLYKEDDSKVVLFSRLTFFAGLAAIDNLGALFGNISARPFWEGAGIPLYFIIAGLIAGVSILIATFYFVEDKDGDANQGESILPLLGKINLTLLGMLLFYKFWHILNGLYSAVPGKYEASLALLTGPLAFRFWALEIGLVIVIPALLMITSKGFAATRVFQASALSLVGLVFMHNNFVAAGQVVPINVVGGTMEISYHLYQITWAEWGIFLGAIGGAIFIFLWLEENLFSGDGKIVTKWIGKLKSKGVKA